MKLALMATLLPISFAGLMGCNSSQPSSTKPSTESPSIGRDFLVSLASGSDAKAILKAAATTDETCEEHIARITCVSQSTELKYDSDCKKEPVTAKELADILKVKNLLPEFHQKVFCHLQTIQLRPKLPTVGFAMSFLNNDKKTIGHGIGLRFDSTSQEDIWSWKEQLNFGLTKPDDANRRPHSEGPFVTETAPNPDGGLSLLITVIHEISHLIDHMNDVTRFVSDCDYPEDDQAADAAINCHFSAGSFPALSWPMDLSLSINSDAPSKAVVQMYPWLSQMCYYFCEKTMAPQDIPNVYAELRSTSFMTSYSASSTSEDFADSSVAFLMKNQGYVYEIRDSKSHILFDLETQWEKPQLESKKKWLSNFYSRSDLKFQ